jgi:hypothetical protein
MEYVAEQPFTSEGFSGHRVRTALWEGIQALDEADCDPQAAFLLREARALLPRDPPEVRSGVNAWPYVLGVQAEGIDLPPGGTLEIAVLLFGEAAETWPAWALGGRELKLGRRSLRLRSMLVAGRDGAMTAWKGGAVAGGMVTLGDLCPPAVDVAQDLLAIDLLTPARKRRKDAAGEWVDDDLLNEGTLLKFLRALYPRLQAVARADLQCAVRESLEQTAARIPVVVDETSWATVTHRGKPFGGRIGRFICHGPIEPLLPLLTIGQLTHVGSESTWGLGRYGLTGCAAALEGEEPG